MKIRFMAISALIALHAFVSYGKVIDAKAITTIDEILSAINESKEGFSAENTLVVFDFDETISAHESEIKALREEKNTLHNLEKIKENGFQTIIVTSRKADQNSAASQVKEMKNLIGEDWGNQKVIHDSLGKAQVISCGHEGNLVVLDDIVFVNTCLQKNKGEALKTLIDGQRFAKKFDNVIFIDNDLYKVMDVMMVFFDRSEGLYLRYYPLPKDIESAKYVTGKDKIQDQVEYILSEVQKEKK